MIIKPGIVEAKFTRSGIKTNYTKLWKDIDESTRSAILKRVNLIDNEAPILYFYSPNQTGWLLTTENLYIFSGNITKILKLTNLDRVAMKDIFDGTATKMECTFVQLFSKDGVVNLETEVLSWPIIFGIFHFVIRKVNG